MPRFVWLIAAILAAAVPQVSLCADNPADVAAIEALLQEYRRTQDAGDLLGQAKLMSPNRIWINQAGERRTDNAENMRIQQMQEDAAEKRSPGVQQITTDRDVVMHFHGDGKVAIVSFHRFAYRAFPPGTSAEVLKNDSRSTETGTLVLEKQGATWKIVHTHWSGPN